MKLFILLTSVVFIQVACVSTPQVVSKETQSLLIPIQAGLEAPLAGPIEFKIDGIANIEQHSLYTASNTKTYQNEQLVHEQMEAVEFKTTSETKPRNENSFFMTTKTIYKDGPTDLESMGYPELGESLDYIISKKGVILKAGSHPEKSLFFIPQLPFPKTAVQKGETWTYSTHWVSLDTQSILKLDIVLLLKEIRSCKKSICVEVEYSGNITQPELAEKAAGKQTDKLASKPHSLVKDENKKLVKIQFTSRLKGFIRYNLNLGQVVYGYQTNDEEIFLEGARIHALSCSETMNAEINSKPSCDPSKSKYNFNF